MARPKTTGTTPQFSFRLDPKLRAALTLLAKADGDRPLGTYIELVMARHAHENRALIEKLRSAAATYPDASAEHHLLAAEAASIEEGKKALHAKTPPKTPPQPGRDQRR